MTGTTTSETDWAHLLDFHPHVGVVQHATAVSSAVESTVVVETSPALSAAAAGTSTGTGIGIGIGTSSSANRRAGKPARRRSRASRKAPTTLFNTDTNNFRAMVQQFTGFPSGQGHGHPPPQPPPMTFHHQFNQHHHPPPPLPQQEVVGTAPFGLPVQQQPQVYFHQQHLFGLGSSNRENPFLSGFGSGSSSNHHNHNNDSGSNNNNDDDVNNQNLRSNMEYYSFDQFDRTNGRF